MTDHEVEDEYGTPAFRSDVMQRSIDFDPVYPGTMHCAEWLLSVPKVYRWQVIEITGRVFAEFRGQPVEASTLYQFTLRLHLMILREVTPDPFGVQCPPGEVSIHPDADPYHEKI